MSRSAEFWTKKHTNFDVVVKEQKGVCFVLGGRHVNGRKWNEVIE